MLIYFRKCCYLPGANLASSPELIEEEVALNDAKLSDVFSLLANRFGTDWCNIERLSYFKQFYDSNFNSSEKVLKLKAKELVEETESDCSCCGEDNDDDSTF